MKILQINDDYQRKGGAETYFFNLINLLKKNNHQVSVFAIRGKPMEAKDTLVVGEAKGFFRHYLSSKVFNFKVYLKLKSVISRTKPNIIHIHNNYLAPLSVLMAVRGYKVVQTVHDYMILCPHGWMVRKDSLEICQGNIGAKCLKYGCLSLHNLLISYLPFKLRKAATKKVVGRFISPSKRLKRSLEVFGFQNVKHLPYFIDVRSYHFNPNLKKDGNILYIGRLVREKGISDLIKTLPKVASKIGQARLTIIGDGPQREDLISLAKSREIANKVNFIGRIPHEQVKEYYQKADLVIVPSLCVDNSPNVVYEAFSTGRPVIASDRGGMSDFVKDGETGFIFESGNINALAEKIVEVLEDKDLSEKLSSNCRRFSALNLIPERHYKKIIEIYESVGS